MDSVLVKHTLYDCSIAEIHALMLRGELTAESLVLAYIERIEEQNPLLSAFVFVDREGAISAAKKADLLLKTGEPLRPFHGIPISVKDNIMVANFPTTAGYAPFKSNIQKKNAPLIDQLIDAGAIILGKTNLPALTFDMQTNNSLFGRTNNPWDIDRTPGGSSGGCAAAVASSMSQLSVCNDSGGSVRIPAHFCGIFGLKPSFGTTSTEGITTVKQRKPAELSMRSLLTSGILARSVDDLRRSLSVVGKSRLLLPKNEAEKCDDLKLLWIDELPTLEVDSEMKHAIQNLTKTLELAGVKLTRFEPSAFDFLETIRMWGHLSNFETGTELPVITRRVGSVLMRKKYNKIPMYTHLLKPLSKQSYRALRRRQEELKVKFEQLLDGFDGFILSASSVLAIPHQLPNRKLGHLGIYTTPLTVNDKKVHYALAIQAYSLPFNVLESPVISMPIGLSKSNLPIGIQLVGKKYRDFDLLDVAEKLSEIIPSTGKPSVFGF